jgi:hypothetical protein
MKNKFLDTCLTIRLSQNEREKLNFDAEMAGVTVSELVRRRYFGRPIVAKSDEILVRELRRQGGLLKNNFSVMREANCPERVFALQEEALKNIIKLIEHIGEADGSQKSKII